MQQGEVLWYQWWFNYNGGDEDDIHGDDHNIDDINDYIIGNDHDRDDFNNDIYDDDDKCHYSLWEKNIILSWQRHRTILYYSVLSHFYLYMCMYIYSSHCQSWLDVLYDSNRYNGVVILIVPEVCIILLVAPYDATT